ncbi:MAG: antitoxin Xre-like helix-turn-helix domain-containing protein, partial [Steroidobacteraceae bacterium]
MSEKADTYSTHLSALLTGQRYQVREPTQWHERILEGLPVAAMESVKARAALTDAEMARLLGVGEATLRRARVSGAALDPA